MSLENKKLFVIWPMKDPDSVERERSERIEKDYIKPAAERAGYESYDDKQAHGLTIAQEIYMGLEGDPMVIAYLGYPPWNENVMFEVGYRLATSKPLVILRHSDTTLPFDLQDQKCITLPPYDQLETKDESHDERIVESIARTIHDQRGLIRLNSAYAVADILIDQRDLADENGRETIFTASSEAGDRIFHMKDSLIGRKFTEIENSLSPRLEECQRKPFFDRHYALIARLMMGQGQDLNDIRATVPFIFKDSSIDDMDSPEYVDPELRGRAFLAIIVQHRKLPNALSLRMLYVGDVKGALKREEGHYVCDLPKVRRLIIETIQKLAKRSRKEKW